MIFLFRNLRKGKYPRRAISKPIFTSAYYTVHYILILQHFVVLALHFAFLHIFFALGAISRQLFLYPLSSSILSYDLVLSSVDSLAEICWGPDG